MSLTSRDNGRDLSALRRARGARLAAAAFASLLLGLLVACRPPDGAGSDASNSIEDAELRAVEVAHVAVDPETGSPVVVLREVDGGRRELPIWIGPYEARSIAIALRDLDLPRPNPHDLIRELFVAVEGTVDRVVVTELRDSTYFAVIRFDVAGRRHVVDARPSDAIAVALRTETPVFAHERLLAGAGEALDVRNRPAELPLPRRELRIH